MQIREYGEVILCKNITFEDNKYDLEGRHPGIVLLPTTEDDNKVSCLYMTSDDKRAKREKDKYIKNSGKSVKDSYINLQQIVRVINNKERAVNKLSQKEFVKILENFYNYQMNLEPQKQDFLDIKEKIKTLLDLLKINEKLEIEEQISAGMLESLMKIKDAEKREKIYATKIATLQGADIEKIEMECFTDGRERNYYNKLMELLNTLKNMDFSQVDFNDSNNAVRKIYLDIKNRYFFMNADLLFNDVTFLLDDDKKTYIERFIASEMEREQRRQSKKEERIENNKEKRQKGRIQRRINEANHKNKFNERKYGKSEFLEL